jgi:bacterioferritin-associated ferredoxin
MILTTILININIFASSTHSSQDSQPIMYVCLCKGVTDTQIRQAVENGAASFGQIRRDLSLAAQCGKCGILARQVYNESIEQQLLYAEANMDQQQLFYAAG